MEVKRKMYYTVQVNKSKRKGNTTCAGETESVHHFEENDVRKAITLFKRRKHNDIILTVNNYIPVPPYVNGVNIPGIVEDKVDPNDPNTVPVKIIHFKNKSYNIDIEVPYQKG